MKQFERHAWTTHILQFGLTCERLSLTAVFVVASATSSCTCIVCATTHSSLPPGDNTTPGSPKFPSHCHPHPVHKHFGASPTCPLRSMADQHTVCSVQYNQTHYMGHLGYSPYRRTRVCSDAPHSTSPAECLPHSAMELSNIGFGMRCVPTQKRTNGGIPHTVQGIEPVCIICNHYGRQSTYKATIFINTTWEAQKNCFASEFQVQGSDSWMQVLIHAHGCHAVPTISPDHVAAVQIQEEKHAATPQHLSLHTPCPARYCGLSVNY